MDHVQQYEQIYRDDMMLVRLIFKSGMVFTFFHPLLNVWSLPLVPNDEV